MSDWGAPRRILAVRLDSLGDLLMTTPALRALREAPATEHLALLTSPAGAAAAKLIPGLDTIIRYEAPWMKAGDPHPAEVDHALIRTLSEGRYDAAVIFTVFSQTPFPAAMLAYLAGIPRILAYVRERAYKLVSDAVQETEPEQGIRHEARRLLDLVASRGYQPADERLGIEIPSPARAKIAAMAPKGPWAVVHPGASAPSRRYPPELFAEALAQLARDNGWRFLLTGSSDEAPLTAVIKHRLGDAATDLAGTLDLEQLAALIEAAPVLITNNSGPAHIAAATQTPVVDLYALTNPQHTPWMVPARVLSHDVDCRWCFASVCKTGHHACLRGVAPQAVAAAALELAAARQAQAA